MCGDAERVIWGIVMVILTAPLLTREENKPGSIKGTIVSDCGRAAVEGLLLAKL